jgi:hypothetical protein
MAFLGNKLLEITIGILLLVVLWMGYAIWNLDSEIEELTDSKIDLMEELHKTTLSLSLATANGTLLRMSISAQNKQITELKVDVERASKQYKIEEKRIYETIYSERAVLKDLNASEDCNQSKRIADEIINLW